MKDDVELGRLALQQAGDAIIVIDAGNIIRVWNDHCVQLFGYTAEQAIGQDVKLIIPERLREPHDRAFAAAMARGALASDGRARRTKGVTASGEKVYVEMTFAMLKGPDGTALGSVAVARRVPDA